MCVRYKYKNHSALYNGPVLSVEAGQVKECLLDTLIVDTAPFEGALLRIYVEPVASRARIQIIWCERWMRVPLRYPHWDAKLRLRTQCVGESAYRRDATT